MQIIQQEYSTGYYLYWVQSEFKNWKNPLGSNEWSQSIVPCIVSLEALVSVKTGPWGQQQKQYYWIDVKDKKPSCQLSPPHTLKNGRRQLSRPLVIFIIYFVYLYRCFFVQTRYFLRTSWIKRLPNCCRVRCTQTRARAAM